MLYLYNTGTIFINDIPDIVRKECRLNADDSKHIRIKDKQEDN